MLEPKNIYRTLPASTWLALILASILGLIFLPQMFALWLTAPETITAKSGKSLAVFEIVSLWGKSDPTSVSGALIPGFVHWALVASPVLAIGAGIAVYFVVKNRRKKNPQLKKGLASMSEARKAVSEKAVMKDGQMLRKESGITDLSVEDCGYKVGEYLGADVFVRVEDPMIIIGPSRSGKGWNFVLNWIVNAPGAVVTSSSKTDNLALTLKARQQTSDGGNRDVWVFAPGVQSVTSLGLNLKWDPVAGCIEEETLLRRIKSLIPAGAFGGSTSNGGHWDTLGQQLAAHLFHAAACAGGDVDLIWSWVSSPTRAQDAVRIIREHENGMVEHASHLEEIINQPPEQRASSWGTLTTVLAFMESRSAREWMKPTENDREFDITKFAMKKETLYLVGGKKKAPAYKVIIEGLLAEIDYELDEIATLQGGRLDPPVTYLLDEAANFTYPGLESLITEGGGKGMIGVPIFQSKAQLAEYGEKAEQALWDAAVVKLILPGSSDPGTLKEIQTLIGETWVKRESHTHGQGPLSISVSEQKEFIFTEAEIREMEKTHCILFYRNLRPIVPKMSPFNKNPMFAECMKNKAAQHVIMNEASKYKDKLAKYKE